MTRRMTADEAVAMIETVFEQDAEAVNSGLVEAFVGDMDTGRAKADVDSYLATVPGDIDPDTISITADVIEGSSIPAVQIQVRVQ